MRYAVVIEPGDASSPNLSGYVPDLPGCVATGATETEVLDRLRDAIALHVQGLREDGLPVPAPLTHCGYVEAAA